MARRIHPLRPTAPTPTPDSRPRGVQPRVGVRGVVDGHHEARVAAAQHVQAHVAGDLRSSSGGGGREGRRGGEGRGGEGRGGEGRGGEGRGGEGEGRGGEGEGREGRRGGEKIVKGEFKELFFLLFFLQQQHNKQKTKSRTTSKQNK